MNRDTIYNNVFEGIMKLFDEYVDYEEYNEGMLITRVDEILLSARNDIDTIIEKQKEFYNNERELDKNEIADLKQALYNCKKRFDDLKKKD